MTVTFLLVWFMLLDKNKDFSHTVRFYGMLTIMLRNKTHQISVFCNILHVYVDLFKTF